MFEPVSPQISFPKLEDDTLRYWKANKIFEKSTKAQKTEATGGANQDDTTSQKPHFVFYEGPPTANGMPHPGHVLTRVIKDVFLRYRTMCGYHVPRRGGWDTHGLPVEVEVEKTLGIHGRQEIEKYGVEAFTRKCIDSVFRYIKEWQRMTDRIGFWVDLDTAYVTFHKSYIESVWWALSELYKKGLLYQDYKVVWWWPQGGTALSAGEVGQGYRTVDDPSVIVRFAVKGQPNTSFLAWTTTPWTLPSNVALAVSAKEHYVLVEMTDGENAGERFIIAQSRVEAVLKGKEHVVLSSRPGAELVGTAYEPIFTYAAPHGGKAYEILAADFVTLDSGTGIVHVAPAFGEDDFRVAKAEGFGFLQLVLPDGTFPAEVTDFAGQFCKDADKDVIRHLKENGVLFSHETYRHEYPFCWRADSDPLIQYARRSWFVRTSQFAGAMLENNAHVHWEPNHIKDGRFGDFLRNNVDWALSRERFWGTPLPIWINDVTGAMDVVSSCEEILARNPDAFRDFEAAKAKEPGLSHHLIVHKPWIDDVTWTRPGEPGVYRRVPEVIDCWFDSGCMPFAQQGYPHTGHAAFEHNYPADFITEAVDQTRGWFYSLLAISTLLFPEDIIPRPYKHCVVIGLITDAKGQKLSKSKKNYDDPLVLIETHGADAVRWSLYSSCVPGQPTKFYGGAATEAVREFLLKIWNVYSFFVTYARIDEWTPTQSAPTLEKRAELDRWILAELNETIREVRTSLDAYKSYPAARSLSEFVDTLSNWYVRRSRSRFWASSSNLDKRSAFATLYEVLVELSKLIAPFTPFVAETLYQNLVHSQKNGAPESVHLASFPETRDERRDDKLRADMALARTVVNLGQRVRAEQKLKVRQPVSEAIVAVTSKEVQQALSRFEGIIREELNIHTLTFTEHAGAYVEFTLVPNFRTLGPRLGPLVPKVKQWLGAANGTELHRQLGENGKLDITIDGQEIELSKEDIEVRLVAKESFAAASERGQVVILNTHITQELHLEGLAREVINRIQKSRKDMDLPFEARIHVTYEGSDAIKQAIHVHADTIRKEVLALPLPKAPPKHRGARHEHDIEGEKFICFIAESHR